MNETRRTILATALLIVALMAVIPPWVLKVESNGQRVVRPAGYSIIFDPPEQKRPNNGWSLQIDFSTLFMEWVVVAAIAGGAWLIAGNKEK